MLQNFNLFVVIIFNDGNRKTINEKKYNQSVTYVIDKEVFDTIDSSTVYSVKIEITYF